MMKFKSTCILFLFLISGFASAEEILNQSVEEEYLGHVVPTEETADCIKIRKIAIDLQLNVDVDEVFRSCKEHNVIKICEVELLDRESILPTNIDEEQKNKKLNQYYDEYLACAKHIRSN